MKSVEATKAALEAFNVHIYQIKQLTNERDTARRMYFSEVDNTRPHGIYAEDIAKSMGWDCYKKEETK